MVAIQIDLRVIANFEFRLVTNACWL